MDPQTELILQWGRGTRRVTVLGCRHWQALAGTDRHQQAQTGTVVNLAHLTGEGTGPEQLCSLSRLVPWHTV